MQKIKHDTNSLELSGIKVNYLTVISRTDERRGSSVVWLCKCDCGKDHYVKANVLNAGKIKSCGCMKNQLVSNARKIHGHAILNTPTYVAWRSMLQRCEYKNHKSYAVYGGVGIFVCERWKGFENFLIDMGERPDGMTLDRKDNSLGYSKENCKWSTHKEQANNRKNNKFILYKEQNKTVSQWAEFLGIPRDTLAYRLKSGWTIDRAFNEKVFHGKNLSSMNKIRLEKHRANK